MKLIIYLAGGGVLGTLARFGLQGLIQPPASTFPWGTLVVNILGSFALGFLIRFLLGSGVATPDIRAAATIGFCGAFTTMSAFSYETIALLRDGEYLRAGWYLVGTIGGSLMATAAGLVSGGKVL